MMGMVLVGPREIPKPCYDWSDSIRNMDLTFDVCFRKKRVEGQRAESASILAKLCVLRFCTNKFGSGDEDMTDMARVIHWACVLLFFVAV